LDLSPFEWTGSLLEADGGERRAGMAHRGPVGFSLPDARSCDKARSLGGGISARSCYAMLACMFGTEGEHILRFELAASVLVPTWEDRWVVMSVEKAPLRSLDASCPRVMKLIWAWLEASEVVVFFLRVLFVLDLTIHVSSRTS